MKKFHLVKIRFPLTAWPWLTLKVCTTFRHSWLKFWKWWNDCRRIHILLFTDFYFLFFYGIFVRFKKRKWNKRRYIYGKWFYPVTKQNITVKLRKELLLKTTLTSPQNISPYLHIYLLWPPTPTYRINLNLQHAY